MVQRRERHEDQSCNEDDMMLRTVRTLRELVWECLYRKTASMAGRWKGLRDSQVMASMAHNSVFSWHYILLRKL